jgi:hypothetical protein
MGFNKRYISKEQIIRSENLEILFNADALIFDSWSGKFFDYYKKGHNKETILKLLEYKVDKDLKNI